MFKLLHNVTTRHIFTKVLYRVNYGVDLILKPEKTASV